MGHSLSVDFSTPTRCTRSSDTERMHEAGLYQNHQRSRCCFSPFMSHGGILSTTHLSTTANSGNPLKLRVSPRFSASRFPGLRVLTCPRFRLRLTAFTWLLRRSLLRLLVDFNLLAGHHTHNPVQGLDKTPDHGVSVSKGRLSGKKFSFDCYEFAAAAVIPCHVTLLSDQ